MSKRKYYQSKGKRIKETIDLVSGKCWWIKQYILGNLREKKRKEKE